MALPSRFGIRLISPFFVPHRCDSILASKAAQAILRKDIKDVEHVPPLVPGSEIPASYRYIYPDFLALPDIKKRNKLAEKLNRMDMLRRRSVMEIPEFYPGSVLAVTTSDPNAPNKTSRFVGICICRGGNQLLSFMILRNVIDGLGCEIKYDLYNPTIRKIEVLKLERRLDEQLFYLRDAPPEHSTFPFDMEATPHPEGLAVPLNETVVHLNPFPWKTRWELYGFRGFTYDFLPSRKVVRKAKVLAPLEWERFDLMKKYRVQIPLEDQEEMFKDILVHNCGTFEKKRRRR
ncbi:39S ribosomal protein L19, mitochondrial [Hypsibius exemplaris]|uniref:Large ribosomal subunit protein bL19m n=1 Tax=Hypsibius exemplaris TaxID=2072580 RepID=A0A1W0WVF9_HYPEX|nr:39S ribosomal protein L19, mitochondrial [Hypsibius exemplaris]